MQLETPEGFWAAQDCEAAIVEEMNRLRADGISKGSVFLFPAPANPETVWRVHALTRLEAVPMPHSSEATAEHLHTLEELRNETDDGGARIDRAQPIYLRLTTTGTTGKPKRVDLNEQQIEFSAEASASRLGVSGDDRWLCCLPLHHIAGLSILFRTARLGATTVLHPNFDPHRVSRAIDEDNIQLVSLVPTMLKRILDAREDQPFPPSLRVILLGGAPCPPSLLNRCRDIQAPVALTWGMTETASQIATRTPGDLRDAPDVGKPLDGITIREHEGLLTVKGPIAPGGLLVTGDRGTLDAEGRVIVFGRGESLIISGGENIDPRRIENVLLAQSEVQEAVVVGRPDAEWGERPVAFVVGGQVHELKNGLAETLHRHEQPAEIHLLTAIPRNEMGKVDRSALRDQAQAMHGGDEILGR